MHKRLIGNLAIILGSLVLSLQLYGLKIIQGIEMQKGGWKTFAIEYARESPISFAILITVAVIIYGIILVIDFDRLGKFFKN